VITGSLILLAGILTGWLLRSLPARRKAPKPVAAVCGCTHHHSMHDPESGACNASVAVDRYKQVRRLHRERAQAVRLPALLRA
jgi:hypothetical protein